MENTNILNKDKIYYISFKDDHYNGMFGTPVKCAQYYKLKLGKQIKFAPNAEDSGYFDVLESDINGSEWEVVTMSNFQNIHEAEQDYFNELAEHIYLNNNPFLKNDSDEHDWYPIIPCQAEIYEAKPILRDLLNHYLERNEDKIIAKLSTDTTDKYKVMAKYLCTHLNIMPNTPESNVLLAVADQD